MFAEYDDSDPHLPLEIMQSDISEEIQSPFKEQICDDEKNDGNRKR